MAPAVAIPDDVDQGSRQAFTFKKVLALYGANKKLSSAR
jgi:hypothetical protein